ncbi:hypothetical protein [Cohnella massiliensis]|uniref:hypothetical protein n=1 Tax=Cohnella massiliensis TaxID=1816691 RepID=UPI0009BC549E|nr:hypothetical protein [Cohnella massiliensis]
MKSYELPKETWENAAENVRAVAPAIANWILKNSPQGEKDAEDFMTDMQLAYAAMMYVAEFARDKCRIVPIAEK